VSDLSPLASEQFCYLRTTGRKSSRPHQIEIWFGQNDATLYMLSGNGRTSDWVANLKVNPSVSVRVGERTFHGTARVVADPTEDALARRLLLEKYQPTYSGDLKDWGETALPIAVDLAI